MGEGLTTFGQSLVEGSEKWVQIGKCCRYESSWCGWKCNCWVGSLVGLPQEEAQRGLK